MTLPPFPPQALGKLSLLAERFAALQGHRDRLLEVVELQQTQIDSLAQQLASLASRLEAVERRSKDLEEDDFNPRDVL